VQRLLALLGLRNDSDDLMARLGPFLRGISMGALVGAAIAGSTILRRARSHGAADRES
jgi:hypothetical protein